MASLKEKYKNQVKFYFLEYNQPNAKPIIEKFSIKGHPQTFFLDRDDQLIREIKGFDPMKDDIEQQIISLLNRK